MEGDVSGSSNLSCVAKALFVGYPHVTAADAEAGG
jgi:hypothetical protein